MIAVLMPTTCLRVDRTARVARLMADRSISLSVGPGFDFRGFARDTMPAVNGSRPMLNGLPMSDDPFAPPQECRNSPILPSLNGLLSGLTRSRRDRLLISAVISA